MAIGAIFRAIVGTATTSAEKSVASRALTSVVRRPRIIAKAKSLRKPNKILTGARGQSIVPYTPPERIKVPSRPTGSQHAGNRQPVDTLAPSNYGQYNRGGESKSIADAFTENPSPNRDDNNDSTARLLATASLLQNQLSSFIPSINWNASVSARGFKTTPLRTVLHYCLAVAFGMIHQTRVGHTIIKVDLFPNENKVDVSFTNSSSLLFEPLNLAFIGAAQQAEKSPPTNENSVASWLTLGAPSFVISKIWEFTKAAKDPKKALDDVLQNAGNLARRLGAAGIWDMAQSDIYAGTPPVTLDIGKPQPYQTMYDNSVVGRFPMLTRQLTLNPQAPVVPTMDYPSHFDLRSLVAQALYDPGVLPPTPDTNVALPSKDLP